MSGRARFLQAGQLALPLGHTVAHARADFIVAPCNEAAVRLIDRWPDWPFGRVAALIGPAASGKSHLATIFASRSGAEIVTAVAATALGPEAFKRRALVVEGADGIRDERGFLHLLNALQEAGASLLLTAREPPAAWRLTLPDLASRLRQVFMAEIGPPDDALIGALLVKLFSDRQVMVGPDLIAYLLPRIERSQHAVYDLVERLDEAALHTGRAVGLQLARAVLESQTTHIKDL